MTDISIKFDVSPSFKVYQAPEEVPTLFSGDKIVVYGIIKKRKSASDQSLQTSVNGTATLTGQVLSKPVEFKLTFEIPPPSDFQSSVEMPIIHHLASKSLIHELQSGDDWTAAATTRKHKNRIVNLSIESGVISSHTAYIALDEDQDQLVEGVIKTWDVVATMANYKKSISSPGQSNPHSIPSNRSMCASIPSPFCISQSCRSETIVNSTVHSTASLDFDEFDDMSCLSSFCHSETIVNSTVHSPTASYDSADEMFYSMLMDSKSCAQASVIRPKNELEFLISLQNTEGFWDFDVFQLLHTFKPLSVDNIQICATVYALAYMEITFSSQHDEWELVARKAEAWLECQTLPDQIDLGKLKKEASDYIINHL